MAEKPGICISGSVISTPFKSSQRVYEKMLKQVPVGTTMHPGSELMIAEEEEVVVVVVCCGGRQY